jgi:cytochrome oxidase Cu insertion factor (SCO1/SenC/PrrC family)
VPGMNSGLNPADPTLVAAFRSALLHQGAIALALVVFLLLLWATMRTFRGATAATGQPASRPADLRGLLAEWARALRSGEEAPGRTVLRIGFGLLWVFDGVLQAQPKMAGGLAAQVIKPAASSSPSWVQHLVNWGGTIWSYHPVQAGAASVWIQIGIGAWLLVAASGPMSQLAGIASAAWGLIVWVFGEAFGGIFAPGLTFLFGAPGAVLFYAVAGALIALPDGAWRGSRLTALRMGTLLVRGMGLLFLGMAVLQAWPGRGFWQGGGDGTLSGMISTMAGTPQPYYLHLIVSGASSFTSAHGWGVNLFAVVALALIGAGLISGRRDVVRYAVWFGACFCLADWLLVEDLGFLGGLGTDPNSMPPVILLFTAGYVALSPRTAPVTEEAVEAVEAYGAFGAEVHGVGGERGVGGVRGARGEHGVRGVRGIISQARGAVAAASAQSFAAVSAVAVILIGAAPMAVAAADRTADPIIAEAIAGSTATLDIPAPGFQLTDQNGRPVSLSSLRGKAVLLTFLDPVCTTDCPIIGAEFREAGVLLGSASKNVELVAVAANPTYYSTAALRAFDAEESLSAVPNWRFLTGSLSQLRQVWQHYNITVYNVPAGAMSAHDDLAVVIDPNGIIRQEIADDPGPGTATTKSSFSVLLAGFARQALAGS